MPDICETPIIAVQSVDQGEEVFYADRVRIITFDLKTEEEVVLFQGEGFNEEAFKAKRGEQIGNLYPYAELVIIRGDNGS